jgi:predicted aspartyl protease
MPTLTLPTEAQHGAVVSASFMVTAPHRDALRRAGKQVPEPMVVRCLIDTGARGTCLDRSVIQSLGIPPSGTVLVHTSSTGPIPVRCNQFAVAVGIVMDNDRVHYPVKGGIVLVTEMDLSHHNIQGLIGRDVLDQGIFVYDGVHRTLTLAF